MTRSKTIAQLADVLRQETAIAPPEQLLVAIQPHGFKPPLYLYSF